MEGGLCRNVDVEKQNNENIVLMERLKIEFKRLWGKGAK